MTEQLRARVLVLGGGPGGYAAAIRAGQLGLDTVLVETDRLGGACLNRGCIPSKALIHAAGQFATVQRALNHGLPGVRVAGEVQLDWRGAVEWKDGLVRRLNGGVAALLRKAGVRTLVGWGVFSDAKTCLVRSPDGELTMVEAEHVVLAAGAEAIGLESVPWSNQVISSTEALDLDEPPARLAIVGAGYIGLELGMAFRQAGSSVVVLEARDRILPQYEADLTAPVAQRLAAEGVEIRLGARVGGFREGRLHFQTPEGADEVAADTVLVTVGRRPRLEGWGLETMGVDVAQGAVQVDSRCHTSMRNVWAIGDLVGEPMLAHRATAQGIMVAEIISGERQVFEPAAVPAVCFTRPEIVVVGDLSGAGVETLKADFPLAANGRALTLHADESGGFVRVVARADDHRILGIAAVGDHVAELSGEMTALIEMGAVLEDLAGIIHAHPTQSEMLNEAALRALGRPLHI